MWVLISLSVGWRNEELIPVIFFSRFPPCTPSPYLAKEGFNCNAVENWIRSEPNVLRTPSSSESGINPAILRYVGAPAVDPLTFRNPMARHFIYTLYTT